MRAWFGDFNRRVNVFGTNLEIPMITQTPIIEEVITQVASKNDERQTLRQCLDRPVVDIITGNAQAEVDSLSDDQALLARPKTIAQALKQKDTIEALILNLIVQEANLECRKYIEAYRKGKVCTPPDSFPKAHKQAQAIIEGQIASSVGVNQCRQFLVNESIGRQIRAMSKDLFFAINNGLDVDQQVRFTRLMFDLLQIQTADSTNPRGVRKTIVDSIKSGKPIDIFHVKCLRFVYPYGNRVALLESTKNTNVPTKNGSFHQPPKEAEFASRLLALKSIFNKYGILVILTLLLSDQDIFDYFPQNSETNLPIEDIRALSVSLDIYHQHLNEIFISQANVINLRDYLDSVGLLDMFDCQRQSIIDSLSRGSGLPERYVEEKVDYRTESNSKILTNPPSRHAVRARVYAQIASMQALSVLSATNSILIEEDRGNDNKFIGGYKSTALPVLFVQLRD